MPAPIALFTRQNSIWRCYFIRSSGYSQETDKEHGADCKFSLNAHLERPDLVNVRIMLVISQRNPRTIGIGIAIIMRSVMISVAVNTLSMSRVLEHCVKNISIGAQLRLQSSPHWKTVAKKNAKLHVVTMPIMIQLAMLEAWTWPKILRHRNKIDSLIRPKASFSVVWNPYLYWGQCKRRCYNDQIRLEGSTLSALCSVSVETGKSSTTGEWPVITFWTHPDAAKLRDGNVGTEVWHLPARNMAFRARTNTYARGLR